MKRREMRRDSLSRELTKPGRGFGGFNHSYKQHIIRRFLFFSFHHIMLQWGQDLDCIQFSFGQIPKSLVEPLLIILRRQLLSRLTHTALNWLLLSLPRQHKHHVRQHPHRLQPHIIQHQHCGDMTESQGMQRKGELASE